MRLLPLVLAALAVATSAGAGPRRCGDDVDGKGRSVPCACGDVLVSSRTLGAQDPVAHQVCPAIGLQVAIPAGRPGATLALGGTTITGNGQAPGIEVLSGGDDGLTIVGPGTVTGFDTGVLARRGVRAIRDVLATDNHANGFEVGGSGYEVRNCAAVRNGRDGFVLRGRTPRLEGNRALQNHRHGFQVAGRDASIGVDAVNESSANGGDGLHLRGRGHVVEAVVATANGGGGIRARVSRGTITGTTADHNGGDGVAAVARDLTVASNAANDNGGEGIRVRGRRLADGGGNRAQHNHARRAAVVAHPECRVGTACR
jgi:hypothetical protein